MAHRGTLALEGGEGSASHPELSLYSNIKFVITHVPSWLHYHLYLWCTVNSALYNNDRVFQFKELVFKYVTALSLSKYLLRILKFFCLGLCRFDRKVKHMHTLFYNRQVLSVEISFC